MVKIVVQNDFVVDSAKLLENTVGIELLTDEPENKIMKAKLTKILNENVQEAVKDIIQRKVNSLKRELEEGIILYPEAPGMFYLRQDITEDDISFDISEPAKKDEP